MSRVLQIALVRASTSAVWELYVALLRRGAVLVLAAARRMLPGLMLAELVGSGSRVTQMSVPAGLLAGLAGDAAGRPADGTAHAGCGGEALCRDACAAGRAARSSRCTTSTGRPRHGVRPPLPTPSRPTGRAHRAIGRPIINTQVYVLDERLRPVPRRCRG